MVLGALGIAAMILLLISGSALAGSFTEVWVDDIRIRDNSPCHLYNGVDVNGVYMPDNPYDAIILWKLDSGNWHIVDTWHGASGAVAFDFDMDDNPTGTSTLYLWGDETYGTDGYWSCYEV